MPFGKAMASTTAVRWSQRGTIDGLVGEAAGLCSVAQVLPAEEELPMFEGLQSPLFRCSLH